MILRYRNPARSFTETVTSLRLYRLCAEVSCAVIVTTRLVARSGRQRIMAATISSMPHPVRADTTDRMMRFKHHHNRSLLRFKISQLVR